MNQERSPQVLSSFVLKILGFALMTLDHVGLFLLNRASFNGDANLFQAAYVMRCIGRIAMPLFVFFVAEGVRRSHKPWGYFFRLFAMHAAISLGLTIYFAVSPNPAFTGNDIDGNAFADLSLLALTLILFRQKGGLKALSALPIAFAVLTYVVQLIEKSNAISILWLPAYLRPSYSLFGLLLGIGFYFATPLTDLLAKAFIKDSGIPLEAYKETSGYRRMVNLMSISFLFFVLVVFWGVSYIGYYYDNRPYDNYNMAVQSYCLLAAIPLFFYSGKRGYDSKAFRYVSYFYYPVHLAILFLIFSL